MIYRTLFYVNIYGSYKLVKTVRFFWPTLYFGVASVSSCKLVIVVIQLWDCDHFQFFSINVCRKVSFADIKQNVVYWVSALRSAVDCCNFSVDASAASWFQLFLSDRSQLKTFNLSLTALQLVPSVWRVFHPINCLLRRCPGPVF